MALKKRMVFIAITIMISLLAGCSKNAMDQVYNDNSKIAGSSDTFRLDESKETIESGSYKGKLKFSGSGMIWNYESSSDMDLKVPYTLSVKNGKAKIVYISPDNTVVNLVENTDKATLNGTTSLTVPIKKGNNRIKIVGNEADIDIELQIEKGTFHKIS